MLPKFKNIKRFRQVDSTFSVAHKWINDELPEEGSVILADFQTKGKGTGMNVWESEMGKNLLMSIIFYPDFLSAERQFRLNQAFSLALLRTVKYFLPDHEILVKWPNDVLVEKRKIAGLLFQNTVLSGKISTCVAGLGLNINQKVFPEFSLKACSLQNFSDTDFDRDEVLELLLKNIGTFYEQLRCVGHKDIHREYISNLLNFEKQADYRAGEKIFTGKISDINEFGQLEILVDGSKKTFNMKEIDFIIN